jgi:peptidoglycan hydrolase CwlO-like protein
MQIDLMTGVTIISVIFGLVAALIKIIRDQDMKKIDAIDKTVTSIADKQKDLFAVIASINQNISNTSRRLDDLESNVEEIEKKAENQRESLADVRETIAGFGATYVTRRDYNNGKK